MRKAIVGSIIFAAVALGSLSFAQTPRTAAEIWQARYVAALREADDREAQLLRQFDADRETYLVRIAQVSRERNVSAQALAEVTLRLGLQLADGGLPADLAAILDAIEANATRIEELQTRIRMLEAGADPALAAQLIAAGVAIDIGDLDGAETILRAARGAARAAREGAQLREARVIALEANVAALRSDFLAAADLYGEAAETAPESAREARWSFRTLQAGALSLRGEVFGETATLRDAVRLYRDVALPLAPRATAPVDWAATQNDLGITLLDLGIQGGDGQALREAVVAFHAALEVSNYAVDPAGWAETQHNLGNVLLVLGERGDDEALRDAILAFHAALDVHTRAADPVAWAATQNSLGAALQLLGERGDGEALRDAIAAFQAALEVRTRTVDPIDWAMTQNNLGNALRVLGEGGDDEALRDAIVAHREALEVFTPSATPTLWAATQNNLGLALLTLGERGNGPDGGLEAIRDAAVALHAALEVRTQAADPVAWAMTQNNLGNALLELGIRGDGPNRGLDALRNAVTAYRAVLQVLTQAAEPRHWAGAQNNLGNALVALGMRGDDQALREAVVAYRAASEVNTRTTAPTEWAATQNMIGAALAMLGYRGDDQGFRDAVAAHRAAVEVYSPLVTPADWAVTQTLLGNALQALGERGEDAALWDAVIAYRAALEVRNREVSPADWAETQRNLGGVLRRLGERGLGPNEGLDVLREAVTAYGAALEVLSRDAFPAQWADTQFNLALAHVFAALRGDSAQLPSALAAARATLEGFTQIGNQQRAALALQLVQALEALE